MAKSRQQIADTLKRAAAFYFMRYGYSVTFELGVKKWGGRRADVVGNKISGALVLVEVKSSVADFMSDTKYHEYLGLTDKMYFLFGEATYAKLKKKGAVDEVDTRIGILVLDNTTGYLKVVRKAQAQEIATKDRLSLLARLAWRAGEVSKRTTRRRQRLYL